MPLRPCSRIIILTGPPASGKTTLAARLATDLCLPSITKDGIKEACSMRSVALTANHRSASVAALGRFSGTLLEVEVAARRSALFEGNFSADYASERLIRLAQRFEFTTLQIHCFAPVDLLYSRYQQRIHDRHPGHADAERLADIRDVFDPGQYLLAIPGDLISVDTTSFDRVEYEEVRVTAMNHLASA